MVQAAVGERFFITLKGLLPLYSQRVYSWLTDWGVQGKERSLLFSISFPQDLTHELTHILQIRLNLVCNSGSARPGIIIWLNPRAGEMKWILRSDWLPARVRWAHLSRSGYPAFVPARNRFLVNHTINPLLTKLLRSIWLYVNLFLLIRFYWPRPHAWSITHIYVCEKWILLLPVVLIQSHFATRLSDTSLLTRAENSFTSLA